MILPFIKIIVATGPRSVVFISLFKVSFKFCNVSSLKYFAAMLRSRGLRVLILILY